MNADRPGWQTTEWWTTLLHLLLAALAMLGVVGRADVPGLEGALALGVTAVFALVSTAWTVGMYVGGRIDLKRDLAGATDVVVMQHQPDKGT